MEPHCNSDSRSSGHDRARVRRMTDTAAFEEEIRKEAERRRVAVPAAFLQRLRQGHYHDFKSPLATPKLALVGELKRLGLEDVAKEVASGSYDE